MIFSFQLKKKNFNHSVVKCNGSVRLHKKIMAGLLRVQALFFGAGGGRAI
jgi:hypothetical protein